MEEMESWLQLGAADSARLLELLDVIRPHVVRIIDRFYFEIQRHRESNAVLEGPEQVERLKVTLRKWLHEVFEGPHDQAYRRRREAIGHVHVKVGLPNRYMFLAMHVIESELNTVIRGTLANPAPYLDSLHKVLTLDLALMTGTFVEGREAKQLDELQTLLVRHLQLSVFLLDDHGVIRSATAASARLAGIPDPVGRVWTDALPAPLVLAGHLEREVARAQSRQVEVTLPRVDTEEEDGSTRSFRIHLLPLNHPLASMLVQLEELTDVVDMEARLHRSEGLAQLGALSAAVSHELRNPLAGISGALQVISGTLPADAPHRPILQKVDAEVRRLNGLVSELLAFAKPRRPQMSPLDLDPLVQETVELAATDHDAVSFEVVGSGSAHADDDLVRQVLHNLLRNAADAAGAGGQVMVSVSDGRIDVQDSGQGVPQQMRATIFKPFETTKTRGTGLGLAISGRSAEAMQGSLRLAPHRDGQGACFELRLLPPTQLA